MAGISRRRATKTNCSPRCARRLVTEFDEQLRLTISPPKLGQWIGGLVVLAIGIGWLWLTTDGVGSFVNDARAKQQPVFDLFCWLLLIPFPMIGAGLWVLSIVVLFGRTWWTVDRNLLPIRGQVFD